MKVNTSIKTTIADICVLVEMIDTLKESISAIDSMPNTTIIKEVSPESAKFVLIKTSNSLEELSSYITEELLPHIKTLELTKEYYHQQSRHWFNTWFRGTDQNYQIHVENDGSNFCGNCRYCHRTVSGKYICTEHYVKDIDPDDSSCKKFRNPYKKPDHVCCEKCTRADEDRCKGCNLYPF